MLERPDVGCYEVIYSLACRYIRESQVQSAQHRNKQLNDDARLNEDGTLDTTGFGTFGIKMLPLANAFSAFTAIRSRLMRGSTGFVLEAERDALLGLARCPAS